MKLRISVLNLTQKGGKLDGAVSSRREEFLMDLVMRLVSRATLVGFFKGW
jgi:hypothetical protein